MNAQQTGEKKLARRDIRKAEEARSHQLWLQRQEHEKARQLAWVKALAEETRERQCQIHKLQYCRAQGFCIRGTQLTREALKLVRWAYLNEAGAGQFVDAAEKLGEALLLFGSAAAIIRREDKIRRAILPESAREDPIESEVTIVHRRDRRAGRRRRGGGQ